jgi:hypothetical protein
MSVLSAIGILCFVVFKYCQSKQGRRRRRRNNNSGPNTVKTLTSNKS